MILFVSFSPVLDSASGSSETGRKKPTGRRRLPRFRVGLPGVLINTATLSRETPPGSQARTAPASQELGGIFSLGVVGISCQTLRRSCSVVRTFPKPIRRTLRPCNCSPEYFTRRIPVWLRFNQRVSSFVWINTWPCSAINQKKKASR